MLNLKKSLLEEWMRQFYFSCKYDLGSSGVKNFSVRELFELINLKKDELDSIIFDDSDTFGCPELRQCISSQWGDGDPSSVLVANGSNEVIFFLLTTLLEKGDEVVALDPIYHTLGQLAESIGCNVRKWVLDPKKDFEPSIEDLKKILSSKTKMVIVNFPHNPTGVSIQEKQLQELIDIVAEKDAFLVWDAAFEDVVFSGKPLPNPYLSYKKTIYFGTMSKCYGLAGLRVGWCIAKPEVIRKCGDIKDYTSLYVSPLNELISIYVVNNIKRILDKIHTTVQLNYQTLSSWMVDHEDFIEGKLPAGGVSTFLKILGQSDTQTFCKQIAYDKRVLLIPGICFGHPAYVRLGFGASSDKFNQGLEMLSDSIRSLSKTKSGVHV